MKPTRQAQPYRDTSSRGPSPTLDTMRAGRMKGAPGAALMHASNQARLKPKGNGKRLIPRF